MSKLGKRAAAAVCASTAVLALAFATPGFAQSKAPKLKFPKFIKVGSAN